MKRVLDREAKRQAILQAARAGVRPQRLRAGDAGGGGAGGGPGQGDPVPVLPEQGRPVLPHRRSTCWRAWSPASWSRRSAPRGPWTGCGPSPLGQFDFFLRHRDTLQLLAPFSNPSLARLHKRLIAAMMEKWAGHVQRITALVEEGQRTGAIRRDIEPRQHRPGLHRHDQPGGPGPGPLRPAREARRTRQREAPAAGGAAGDARGDGGHDHADI